MGCGYTGYGAGLADDVLLSQDSSRGAGLRMGEGNGTRAMLMRFEKSPTLSCFVIAKNKRAPMAAIAGSALLFFQTVVHEGQPVRPPHKQPPTAPCRMQSGCIWWGDAIGGKIGGIG